jgi:hypothetical protein
MLKDYAGKKTPPVVREGFSYFGYAMFTGRLSQHGGAAGAYLGVPLVAAHLFVVHPAAGALAAQRAGHTHRQAGHLFHR